MGYFEKRRVECACCKGEVYITDDYEIAKRLRQEGQAVMICLTEENREKDLSEFMFAVENPAEMEDEYVTKVLLRHLGLPWKVLETKRCLVRETTVADVDDFFQIYQDPQITRYTDALYPDIEEERQYVREYIEKVYAYYGVGVWTILEKSSGRVIGRAGFSFREGYEDPEIGFVIGTAWQRKGYAYEVCRAILDYGKEEYGLHPVQALVEPDNRASVCLCEKLGFQKRGHVLLNTKEYVLYKNDTND